VNHIGGSNKMVSDTPISDSTAHNVAELGMLCRRLERLAAVRLAYITQLETEKDAANAEIERLTNKVAQLYEGADELKQRIKRLEEAGDKLSDCADQIGWTSCESPQWIKKAENAVKEWRKAKEAKL
jgi:peptidoglycan hydrolase CwlO-like protein